MTYPEIRFRRHKRDDGLKALVGSCGSAVVGFITHDGRQWHWECPGRAQPRAVDDLEVAKQQLRTFWRTGKLP